MVVIFFVTSKTILRQFDFLLDFLGVAGVTIQSFVLAIEFIIGLRIVIEAPHQPIRGAVTEHAIGGQAFFMHVVFCVTGIAVDLGVLEFLCHVTIFARQQGMRAMQRKLGLVMIEFHLFGPALFAMTFTTRFAFLALMRVV